MKDYTLTPTPENILESFSRDILGRNNDIFRFIKLLDSFNSCRSIALNGGWGSGKTFFVKQAKLIWDSHNPNSAVDSGIRAQIKSLYADESQCRSDITTAYYDAWENDNDTDPIISLLYATVTDSNAEYKPESERSLAETLTSIFDAVSNKDLTSVYKSLKGDDPFCKIRSAKSINNLVNDFIEFLIAERGNRLVFFIDELDRCRPEYAVKLLERVKHFFNDHRVTFVFSVNLEQLQHTVSNYYGESFNASRYLDKLFDLRIRIPECDQEKFIRSKFSFLNSRYIYHNMCINSACYFHLSLREIERYMAIMEIIVNERIYTSAYSGFSEEMAVSFCVLYIVPFMVALNICDLTSYSEFIAGNNFEIIEGYLLTQDPSKFEYLLDNDEKFINTTRGNIEKEIDLSSKLRRVYDAVFSYKPVGKHYVINIGHLEFNEEVVSDIQRIDTLLSGYTVFDDQQ